jgi:NAD(P)-dependent dehydrogenase (short-subunit alcohol dehydrogenase family)
METLNGILALVTGAASGIGRALARSLAAEGARLIVWDVDAEGLGAIAAELSEGGTIAAHRVVDVSSPDAVADAAAATVASAGVPDLLCLNAGVIRRFAPLWEQSEDDWTTTLGVNVHGLANCIRALLPTMVARDGEGHVLITASEAALAARPFVGPYHASKHAVLAIAETLALELELVESKIGVSVLLPGAVDTAVLGAQQSGPSAAGRPGRRPRPEPSPGLPSQLERSYRRALKAGTSPDGVAQAALTAVRERRFAVFTHAAVRERALRRVVLLTEGGYPANDAGLRERLAGDNTPGGE